MKQNKTVGGLIGLAVGDALGVPVEFVSRSALLKHPITEMRGYGTHNQPPGTWSDDTSLTYCLVDSILERGFDIEDLASRFIHWYESGYMTPFGKAFDIGNTTRESILRMKQGIFPEEAGGMGEMDNGNGSLMRILPGALYFHNSPIPLFYKAVFTLSSVTHGHPRSILACFYYSLLVREMLLSELSKEEALRKTLNTFLEYEYLFNFNNKETEVSNIKRIVSCVLGSPEEKEISADGYVLNTLKASLASLLKRGSFTDSILYAVNLGDDSDTTAAVAGGLAGIYYGLEGIPGRWRETLVSHDKLLEKAMALGAFMFREIPFTGSYWVLPGKLLAGGFPKNKSKELDKKKLESLVDCSINAIIDLTEKTEGCFKDQRIPYEELIRRVGESKGVDLYYKNIPIKDCSIPGYEKAGLICSTLDRCLMEGRSIYIHCCGGHGRTGTALGCWLLHKGLADKSTVLSIIDSLHKPISEGFIPSPETKEQRDFVLAFQN